MTCQNSDSNKGEGYRILITGIGCVGKSTVREEVAQKYPDIVVTIDLETDMNHGTEVPKISDKIVIAESVHGLESNPKQYNKILYLLPPKNHAFLWLRRAWAWFSAGIVDLANPVGISKEYAISNIPHIVKLVLRNLSSRKQWIKNDLSLIDSDLSGYTEIASSIEEGFDIVERWIKEIRENQFAR